MVFNPPSLSRELVKIISCLSVGENLLTDHSRSSPPHKCIHLSCTNFLNLTHRYFIDIHVKSTQFLCNGFDLSIQPSGSFIASPISNEPAGTKAISAPSLSQVIRSFRPTSSSTDSPTELWRFPHQDPANTNSASNIQLSFRIILPPNR